MDAIKNTFLFKLFEKDKLLFTLIAVYILGILYYAARQREEFPFLLYGMYSLKEKPQPVYYAYSVTIDDQEIKYARLRDAQREVITSSIEHALPLLNENRLDSVTARKFKDWLMNYCLDMRMRSDSRMDIYRLTCNYDDSGNLHVIKKEKVYAYAK